MRNAVIAAAIIVAGISANFGVTSPSSTAGSHSETAGGTSAPRIGRPTSGAQLPEDHPLQVLYEEDERLSPSNSAANAQAPSGTVQVDLSTPQLKLQGTLNVKQDSGANDCSAPKPLNNLNVQFLVATLPDPERTHLALTFDRDVEAIMQGIQDKGYAFSRYWLPWRAETAPENADSEIRKKNEKEKNDRETLPGLMLFRGDNGGLLAVFLVGEAPTSGVDREQFRHASCYIHDLEKGKGDDSFLGILGPEFSGSFRSLDRAITETMPEAAGKPIVSGSATSGRAVEQFHGGHPTFSTTVRDDESAYCRLREQFPAWERVAILSEDSTGYGEGFQPTCAGKNMPAPVTIDYPREISRLRNAYQDDPALAAAQKIQETNTRRQLLLPLRDSETGRDTVPQFSGGQTPASQETVLFQISDAIKRERFQAAIVRGTNVLDILFLSHFLRQCCGDLRVAVLESDLLFEHGTDSLDYLGVVTVGSDALRWEGKPENRVFASDSAEGVYHATQTLLSGSIESRDMKPPLWISVVGRGTYWPVAVDSDKGVGGTPFDPGTGYPSRLWDTVFYTSSLLALLYVAVYIYAGFCDPKPSAASRNPLPRWCADFHPSPERANRGRATYHVLTTLFVLAAYCSLALAPVYLASRASHWRGPAIWAIVTILALSGMAIHTATKFIDRRLGIALAGVIVAMIAGFAFVAFSSDPLSRTLFRAERSAELLSGAAPNLPLMVLFLALAYWAWVNMQRLIFVEERDPQKLDTGVVPAAVVQRMKEPLNSPIFAGSWRRGMGILGCVGLSGYLGSRWIGSLEGWIFNWFFLALLTLCAALLLLTAWAFLRVWHRLRRVLEALNLEPIRFAFTALPTVTTWSPLWQPTARRRSYTIPVRVLETAQRLKSANPVYYPELSEDCKLLKKQLEPILDSYVRGLREQSAETHKMSAAQNQLAAKLAAILENSAWAKGSSATLLKMEEARAARVLQPEELPDTLAAEVVAIRYVGMIRYVMLHLKNQLSFLTVGFILLAISLNCYSFQGEGFFRWWLTTIFVLISSVIFAVFIEMERDATLRRLTDTGAGKVDSGFYLKALSAGALPLLAVVSSQFPGVGRFLFSWLQPALSVLR